MGEMTASKKIDFIIIALILALATWAFSGTVLNHFTNWDDPFYLSFDGIQNFDLQAIFTTPVLSNYFPMILLGFAVDTTICYPEAWCFHLASLAFHLLNVILFYFLVRRLFRRKLMWAILPTLFFAVHPMQVEAVAWMSATNYPQSLVFFLAALHFYISWKQTSKKLYWFASFVTFVIGLLTKHVVFILPVILIILEYNYFPRRQVKALIPFLAASLAAGIASVILYQENNLSQALITSRSDRLEFLLNTILFYGGKLFTPYGQSAFYDYFSYHRPWYDVLAVFLLAAVLFAAIWQKCYRDRQWKALTLISAALIFPFLKLVPFNSSSAFNDRYFYYPVGFVVLWLTFSLSKILPRLIFQFAAVILVLMAFGFAGLSHQRVPLWQNPTTLWNDDLAQNPNSAAAHFKLAELHMNLGDWSTCLEETRLGTAAKTTYSSVLYYLQAQCLVHLSQKDQAVLSLQESLKAQPDFDPAQIMLNNLKREK